MENPQTIISRLKFIGRIKIGEKINTHGTFVQADHFVTAISRTFWHQDNRGNAYSYISETVTKSFDLLNQYRNSAKETERLMLRNILADLKQAKVGILNLKITYAKDAKFCCDLDTLIQNMEAYLIPYQKTIAQYVDEYLPPFQLASDSSGQNQVSTSPPGSHVNISVSARQGTIDVQNNQVQPVSGMLAKQLAETTHIPIPPVSAPIPPPILAPIPSPVQVPIPSPVQVPLLFTVNSDPQPPPFASSDPIAIPDRRTMNISAEESV